MTDSSVYKNYHQNPLVNPGLLGFFFEIMLVIVLA